MKKLTNIQNSRRSISNISNYNNSIIPNNRSQNFRKLFLSRNGRDEKRLSTQPNMTELASLKKQQKLKNNKIQELTKLQVSQPFELNGIKDYVIGMKKKVNKNHEQKQDQLTNNLHLFENNPQSYKSDRQLYLSLSPNKNSPLMINQLEDKVDNFIKNKLTNFIKNNHSKNKFSDQHFSKDINNINSNVEEQLNKLVSEIRSLKQNIGNNEQDIRLVNKKIQLFEKIIAENSIQSEIVKKYYFSLVANKRNTPKVSKWKNKATKLTIPTVLKTPKPIIYDTSNRSSYQTPKRQDYDLYKYQHAPFKLNAQPLPRSTYHRQYLPYGNLVGSDFPYKAHSSLHPYKDHHKNKSTYSKDYRKMKVQRFDIKELDSYKDKLKDINISYYPQKKTIEESFKALKSLKIKQDVRDSRIAQGQTKQFLNHSKTVLKSQNHRQYQGALGISSSIKHKQLSNYKYSYKSLIHA